MIQSSMFDILKQMQPKDKKIIDVINDFNPTFSREISRVFHFMEICEDEISKGMERHPDKAQEIWANCFMLLRTPEILSDKGDSVYRAFCSEIIDRFANNQNTEKPTKAEILCIVMEATWKSPLTQNASAAAFKLFSELFGKIPNSDYIFKDEGQIFVEEWKGAADEIISWAEKRYTRR